jgi:hypothetical protein
MKNTSHLKSGESLVGPRLSHLSLCLIFFLATAHACFSQGTVEFLNSVAFKTIDPTGGARLVYNVDSPLDPVNGNRLAGTNWVAELYAGADAAGLSPLPASISHFRNLVTVLPGTWISRNDFAVLPVPSGATVILMVKVWDSSQFSTYEEAVSGQGLTGASEPFSYVVPVPGSTVSAYYMEGLRAFALSRGPSGCVRHKAQATAQLVDGSVAGVTITDAGCGYTNPPVVLIQGGGGNGAAATAVISNGQISAININNAGCCYTNLPTIVIGSPWFRPTVSIGVSRVKVTQHVVLGREYVLESSYDRIIWTPTGPPFTAGSELVENDFDVGSTGGFFRVREAP